MRLAEPKLAKRAKDGGARRDRTADLLHAMQALSQLSYGPITLVRFDPNLKQRLLPGHPTARRTGRQRAEHL